MKSVMTIKKMIEKIDDKILEKRSMAIIGTFFLILTIISAYLFYTINEGFLFFWILFCGIMAILAFSQVFIVKL